MKIKKLIARIRRNYTGEVRDYAESYDTKEVDPDDMGFSWTSGSLSCDCSLALFYASANNEDTDDVPSVGTPGQATSRVSTTTSRSCKMQMSRQPRSVSMASSSELTTLRWLRLSVVWICIMVDPFVSNYDVFGFRIVDH